MLKLTKKADYGLIAMKYLAEHVERSRKLVRAKLLVSLQGTNGGYRLARDSRTISAFDVIKAIEGPFFITSCVTHKGACEQTSRCTVKEPLQKVSLAIEEVLSKVTIFELAQAGEGNCDPTPPVTRELVSLN